MKIVAFLYLLTAGICSAQETGFASSNTLSAEIVFEDSEYFLKWQMPNETNTDYFLVQHWNNNTSSWKNIKKVDARGHSVLPTVYQIELHTSPKESYRLVVVEMDGLRIASDATAKISKGEIAVNDGF